MSKLQKSIRHKRYSVKKGMSLKLIVDVRTSETIEMDVMDCSFNGLSTEISNENLDQDWVEVGSIVSSAKLTWEGRELALGRLVIRRVFEEPKVTSFAFSTVDIQIPVTGVLTKILEIDFSSATSQQDREMSSDIFSLAHFVENENGNVDLFDRVREFSFFHREWVNSKKYAYQTVRLPSRGERIQLRRSRKGGRTDYIVMGSNDYMGLGAHPEVIEAAKLALDKYGFGSTGSPVTTGLTDLHVELCETIARINGKEAGLLFNSGYAANVGIITSLCASNDLIVADQLCHASIQDAMSMSRGTSRFFKHNNIEHLESVLIKERGNFNGCLVVTEGVFSMDGDVAHLDKIYTMARKYNARVMVDQAHCFGVLGQNGLGVCEKYHLQRDVDIIMGTFSKVCGGIGGFAVGSKEVIDWLRCFSRPQVFSVSLPPSTVAAVLKALEIFTRDRTLLENLRENVRHFVTGLGALGYQINQNHESAVVPLVIGDEAIMGEIYQSLLDDGVLAVPVVYPAVSRKNCRFRFTIMATHSRSDIDFALLCIEKALLKVGFAFKSEKAA